MTEFDYTNRYFPFFGIALSVFFLFGKRYVRPAVLVHVSLPTV